MDFTKENLNEILKEDEQFFKEEKDRLQKQLEKEQDT